MAVSSYGSATDSSGVVRILKDLEASIEGRDVLIVEDIIDSGPDAPLPAQEPAGPQPRLARGLRAADQARAAPRRPADPLRRLRDPEPLRDRLRPRPRSALPEPPLRRRPRRVTEPDLERVRQAARRPVGIHEWLIRAGTLNSGPCRPLTMPQRPRWQAALNQEMMRRFFRSAAFPILIVIVLAFFAQRLISPGETEEPPDLQRVHLPDQERPGLDPVGHAPAEDADRPRSSSRTTRSTRPATRRTPRSRWSTRFGARTSRPRSRAPAARASSRSSPTSSPSSSSSASGSS